MYILGIDPGPIPGVCRLELEYVGDKWSGGSMALRGAEALQVTPGALITVLEALTGGVGQAVAVERFVVGRRASRSTSAAAGARTRDMVGEVMAWALTRCKVYDRPAADVKPWATDKRLAAAGLLDPVTTGMRHARDAARHALFCAVREYGLPDPLSARAGVR